MLKILILPLLLISLVASEIAHLAVGAKLKEMPLLDQFGKKESIKNTTKKIIFAFNKDSAHTCNDLFSEESPAYLSQHQAQFVVDLSSAPSLVKSIFIYPKLKEFKHQVLLLQGSPAPYRAEVDTQQIIILHLEDATITKITTISTKDELKSAIELK